MHIITTFKKCRGFTDYYLHYMYDWDILKEQSLTSQKIKYPAYL